MAKQLDKCRAGQGLFAQQGGSAGGGGAGGGKGRREVLFPGEMIQFGLQLKKTFIVATQALNLCQPYNGNPKFSISLNIW